MLTVPYHVSEEVQAWYARHRALVFRHALRIVNDPIEAEDIVQNVFLNALRRHGMFRGSNVERWLTTLAKNAAIDVLRRGRRRGIYQNAEPRRDQIPFDIEDLALASVQRDDLWLAIDGLSQDHRWLIVASFYYGFTHRDIAKIRRLPLGTVKARIRAALAQLKKVIGVPVVSPQVEDFHPHSANHNASRRVRRRAAGPIR